TKLLSSVLIFLVIIMTQICVADIYMHNPRGSNNRYNERGRGRNNANRMFDSQNNNRGGYNVGNLYYHVGSKLQLEWTNQHSCGNQNAHCDIIIQYMCGDLVRDGTVTSTIPTNPTMCKNLDCNNDKTYGMHEDFYSYINCRSRERNRGLFNADRNLRTNQATRTRQNQNGNRRGYECPEERDYYPYWHPMPWKDIAVLTNDVSRCPMYKTESQNVKDRYACDRSTSNSDECEAFKYTVGNTQYNGTWKRYPSHGIAAPVCHMNQWSRDNHLGNTVGGQTFNFNWTIPNDVNERCVLRMRYNISTGDYDRDNTTSLHNNRRRRDGPGPDVWSRQGLPNLWNNPTVDIFGLDKLKLRLALATQQYGRTFQDRSHTFAIRPRPPGVPEGATIDNVNVRGKRGNIVQVYPGVEYDFVPNTVQLTSGGYAHIQWTGSDSNPNNNDGQGRQGTDRSNMVMIKAPVSVYMFINCHNNANILYDQIKSTLKETRLQSPQFFCLRHDVTIVGGRICPFLIPTDKQFGGDMDELNEAGTYFDLGLRKITSTGIYSYMCTRNNNFSNRSQKG
uniref:Self-marker protein n=1 Tax=Ciona intestinalis TaxID=7719 RepID=F6TGA3_CIOIN